MKTSKVFGLLVLVVMCVVLGGCSGAGAVGDDDVTMDAVEVDAFVDMSVEVDASCVPNCDGKMCGDDGCGGECETCEYTHDLWEEGEMRTYLGECFQGTCYSQVTCKDDSDCEGMDVPACSVPNCKGVHFYDVDGNLMYMRHECFWDHLPAGTPCDDGDLCTEGDLCNLGNKCEGFPKMCWYEEEECVDGECVCIPDCDGKECGSDGCWNVCGMCEGDAVCLNNGTCKCFPNCKGIECGDDGCGGDCGTCDDNNSCTDDLCEEGGCLNTPLPEKTPCDDGNPETYFDSCYAEKWSGLCLGFADWCYEDQYGDGCTEFLSDSTEQCYYKGLDGVPCPGGVCEYAVCVATP